jgi:hypothetical protein
VTIGSVYYPKHGTTTSNASLNGVSRPRERRLVKIEAPALLAQVLPAGRVGLLPPSPQGASGAMSLVQPAKLAAVCACVAVQAQLLPVAVAQPGLVCSMPAFGGCGDEWPRACWQVRPYKPLLSCIATKPPFSTLVIANWALTAVRAGREGQ